MLSMIIWPNTEKPSWMNAVPLSPGAPNGPLVPMMKDVENYCDPVPSLEHRNEPVA